MMCPDAMCRRAPVSISKGIAIKPRVMIVNIPRSIWSG
jgi:hypothetical protein